LAGPPHRQNPLRPRARGHDIAAVFLNTAATNLC
jgi:hypothetical protein